MGSIRNSKKNQENHRKIGFDITYYLKLAELRLDITMKPDHMLFQALERNMFTAFKAFDIVNKRRI